MHKLDWQLYLLPFEQAVEEIKVKIKNIRNELRKRMEYSPIEFALGRVKSIPSIYNKAKRLQFPIDENICWEIRDIAGVRIICQFIEDIPAVVEMIRKRGDMRLYLEKDYVSTPKESGYRGYHLAVEYPIMMANGQVTIPVEIQIRTLDSEMNNIREEIKEAQAEFMKKEVPIDSLLSLVELDLDVDAGMENTSASKGEEGNHDNH